jgi:AcrR family transcriptional regulator
MKALAIHSAVSQSLLHDHFGSKDKLYEAVMRERSKLIVTHYRLTPVASFRGR